LRSNMAQKMNMPKKKCYGLDFWKEQRRVDTSNCDRQGPAERREGERVFRDFRIVFQSKTSFVRSSRSCTAGAGQDAAYQFLPPYGGKEGFRPWTFFIRFIRSHDFAVSGAKGGMLLIRPRLSAHCRRLELPKERTSRSKG
jgi:hypothetical protein